MGTARFCRRPASKNQVESDLRNLLSIALYPLHASAHVCTYAHTHVHTHACTHVHTPVPTRGITPGKGGSTDLALSPQTEALSSLKEGWLWPVCALPSSSGQGCLAHVPVTCHASLLPSVGFKPSLMQLVAHGAHLTLVSPYKWREPWGWDILCLWGQGLIRRQM